MRGPVLFVAADGSGRLRLIAALSNTGPGAFGREGGRARLELVPELAAVGEADPRGRRIDLGRLLAPHQVAFESGDPLPIPLADLAAHLIELPEFGTPASVGQRHPVRLVTFENTVPQVQPLWPVPGGFLELEVTRIQLAAAGFARAALWLAPHTPGGPALRPLGDSDAGVGGLLALLREAQAGGVPAGPNSFLFEWLLRDEAAGGAGLEATEAFGAREGLRPLLQRALLGSGSQTSTIQLHSGPAAAKITLARRGDELAFAFELERAALHATLTHLCARFEPEAMRAALLPAAVPLETSRLLLFRALGKQALSLDRVVDPRTFLLSHPETWGGIVHPGLPAPRSAP